MTAKIMAARRLQATRASPKAAENYLTSLGLKPGRKLESDDNYIRFKLNDGTRAIEILTKKFGKPYKEIEDHNRQVNQRLWNVGPGRIHIGGFANDDSWEISLFNNRSA